MTDSLPAENTGGFMSVLSTRGSINFALSEIFSALFGSEKNKDVGRDLKWSRESLSFPLSFLFPGSNLSNDETRYFSLFTSAHLDVQQFWFWTATFFK